MMKSGLYYSEKFDAIIEIGLNSRGTLYHMYSMNMGLFWKNKDNYKDVYYYNFGGNFDVDGQGGVHNLKAFMDSFEPVYIGEIGEDE
jgi:hypothetical protein